MSKPTRERNPRSLKLAGQHRLLITKTDGKNTLQFVTAEGATPITIQVTEAGIAIQVDGPDLALHASGALSLSAEKLHLHGRQGVEIASGSDLKLAAASELHSLAASHTVRALRGSVDVKASDDVKLSGERVMVNCDETVDKYYRRPPKLDERQPARDALPSAPPQSKPNKVG